MALKYTLEQITEMRELAHEYDSRCDQFKNGLFSIVDGRPIIEIVHPLEMLKVIDPILTYNIEYVMYECPDGIHECIINEQKINVEAKCFDSLIKVLHILGKVS